MYLSEIMKALGDETRLRILNLVYRREVCVCQIIEVIKILQPSASKHLNRLRYAGIINCRKKSQWCFFRISDGFKNRYARLYDFLKNEWDNGRQYKEDAATLERVAASSGQDRKSKDGLRAF